MTQAQPTVEELQSAVEELQETVQTLNGLVNYYQQLHADEVLKVGTFKLQLDTLRQKVAQASAGEQ